ncbi:MAG: alpha-ribazole phosphatase [Henriciella sp.]
MALILLRHTTPKIDPGICYGQTDLEVASTFKVEAATALKALPPFRKIVSSPLIRCRKLADFFAQYLSLNVEEDSRLMEMDFGAWEGQAWSAIPRAEIDAWAADFLHARPHGGESVAMLRARCLAALHDRRETDGSELIVTHAGVIRAVCARGEGAEEFNMKIEFGGFVSLPNLSSAHSG